jgi:hypothetical protein
VALWHLVIPSNPLLALYQLHYCGFGAIRGYERIDGGRAEGNEILDVSCRDGQAMNPSGRGNQRIKPMLPRPAVEQPRPTSECLGIDRGIGIGLRNLPEPPAVASQAPARSTTRA